MSRCCIWLISTLLFKKRLTMFFYVWLRKKYCSKNYYGCKQLLAIFFKRFLKRRVEINQMLQRDMFWYYMSLSHAMFDFRDPGVQCEKWKISYCAQQAKCSDCPLTVEQFDPASPRRFEIVDLTVGVRCGSALDSPRLSRVLPTSLAI